MSDDTFASVRPDDRPPQPPRRRPSWEGGGERLSPRMKVLAGLVVCAGIGLGVTVAQLGMSRVLELFGREPTSAELKRRIADCQRDGDLACQEAGWTSWVRHHADDTQAMANLGFVLEREEKHAAAAAQFKKAVDGGEGAYDLFARYADSLQHLGRVDEAIDWDYRALSVAPRLVDVRGTLARLLVTRHRGYEALSLLENFDAGLLLVGRPAYFEGQRLSIESTLADAAPDTTAQPLRLPVFERHYFAPVSLGDARPTGFMVDTGATGVSISQRTLDESKASYKVVREHVTVALADGRHVLTRGISIDRLRVGPFQLHDVPAVLCGGDCLPLLGQSALSHFDMQSSRAHGVDFLTLTPRASG